MSRKRGRPQPRRQVIEKAGSPPGTTVAVPSGSRLYTQTEMLAAVTAAGQYSRPLPRSPYDAVVPFGPGNPLVPAGINPPGRSGRPEPRQYDYPVSWNLPGFSDRAVPWSILRAAADQIPLFRQCIQVRKDEIATLDWSVNVSDRAVDLALEGDPGSLREDIEKEMRQRCAPHISRLTQFWEEPDRRNGLDFIGWASKALEEHFVLDALSVYARRTRGGDPYSLEILDGTTIKPLLDQYGHRPLPPNPAFQQILQGFPRGEFVADTVDGPDGPVVSDAYRSDQMSYLVHNVRTMTPYGLSSVEQALTDGDLWLRRHGWLRSEYTDGVMPSGWLLAGEGQADWDPSQLREYERAINDYYSGQTENRHRYRILPWGMTPQAQPDQGERYKPDYDLFLLKLVCRHFDTTMAELGFTEPGGLGSAGWHAGQADVQDRAGTKPTQRRLQSWCTRLMRLYLDAPPELEFQIKGLEAEDEVTDDQVAGARVATGRMTLNEDRDRQGKARYAFPEADNPYILTPTGLIFIDGQEAAAEQGLALQQQIADAKSTPPGSEPAPGDPGVPDDGTGTPAEQDQADAQDMSDEAAVAAAQAKLDEIAQYTRWRRRTRSPERPFRFEVCKADDLPHLDPAVDPVVFGGGADPKEPTPEQAWPGWVWDTAIAAAAGSVLSRGLIGLLAGDWISRLVGHGPGTVTGTSGVGLWLRDQGIAAASDTVHRAVLVDLYTEGYLVGERSAESLLTGQPPVWAGWSPGRPSAARRLLAADGRTVGLDMLLSQSDAVIKSISANRLDDLAAVLADGLDRGLGVDEITRAVRGILADPAKARLVTATELQRAQTQAALDRYDMDDIPGVRWLVFPGACPKCQANADAGVIPLGDAFPSGVLGPPGHPNCRCEIVPELDLDRVQLEPPGFTDLSKWDDHLHPRGPDGKFIPTVGGTARLARNLERAKKAGRDTSKHTEALNRRLAYHQANTPKVPGKPDLGPEKLDVGVKKLLTEGAGAFFDSTNNPAQAAFIEHMRGTEYTHPGSGLSATVHGGSTRPGSPGKGQTRGRVSYQIKDRDGKVRGKATRVWKVDRDGNLTVEHHFLEMDRSVQGAGFASAWNAHAEGFYRANGVKSIDLNANLDIGGYAWAKQGYDWAGYDSMKSVQGTIEHRIQQSEVEEVRLARAVRLGDKREIAAIHRQYGGPPYDAGERASLEMLRASMAREAWDSGTAPTPLEIAMFGWEPGKQTWLGKRVMLGASWDGVKTL